MPGERRPEAVYSRDFFSRIESSAQQSAERVLPLVLELLSPRSMVDVGCGSGAWLAEAARLGVDDYLGVDGYTPEEALRIPADRFLLRDLTEPLRIERRFDLVTCLEVAEHLPAAAADVLVSSLARLGPAVLFSAAVPQQGGDRHLNEQWPDYWAELFAAHGLVAVDAVRPVVWRDEQVAWWYRQNALLFCRPEVIDSSPALTHARAATRDAQLSLVQPVLLLWMAHQRDVLAEELGRSPSLREVVGMLPRAATAALGRRLRRPVEGKETGR
jgi:SAM-dependent methyltransferase